MVFLRLRQLFGQPDSRQRSRARPSRRPRVHLEALEDRLAPAQVDWVCDTGNWSNLSCWSTGQLPGADDDVVLGASAVATNNLPSTVIRSLRNLGQLDLVGTVGQSAVLTVAFPSSNEPGATFRLRRAIVDGAGSFANRGTLEAQGVSRLDATFTNQAGATLRVLASNQFNGANSLTFTNSTTNSGRIELTSSNGFFTTALRISNGTLTNAAGGVITSLPGTGGGRNILGRVINQGTLSPTTNMAIDNNATTFDSQAGAITVPAGRTLAVKGSRKAVGGTTLFGAGTTLGGAGIVDLAGTHILQLPTDFTLRSGPRLTFSGAVTVNGPGRFINQATFQSTSDIFNAELINNATLEFLGLGNEVRNSFTTGPASITRVLVSQSHGAAAAIFSQGFTNNNLLELTARLANGNATLTVQAGTLRNPLGSTIAVLAGGIGTRTLAASTTNEGTLRLSTSLRVDNAKRTFTNLTGRINFGSGTQLTIANGNSEFGDAAVLFVGDDTNFLNLAGVHTMSIRAAVFALVSQGPQIKLVGRVTINGPGLLLSQIPLTLTGDIINATLEAQATVTALGTGNEINGTFTPSADVRIVGRNPLDPEFNPPDGGNAELIIGQSFTNRALLELTSLNALYNADLRMPQGTTLTNASGARIEAALGAGGGRSLTVQLVNLGTVVTTTPDPAVSPAPELFLLGAGANHINRSTGLFDATKGHISIMMANSLTNEGRLDIGTFGQAFVPALTLFDGTLTNHSGTTLTGGIYKMNDGWFVFPGANITRNLANIELTGQQAHIYDLATGDALANFAVNDRVDSTTFGRFLVSNHPGYGIAGDFTNNGVLFIGRATVFLVLNGNLTNFNAATLTLGGVNSVYDVSGIFRFNGANIATNDATLILNTDVAAVQNENSQNALAGLTRNNGTLTLTQGNVLSTDTFVNAGTVQLVDAGTRLQSTVLFINQANAVLRLANGEFRSNPMMILRNEVNGRIEGSGTIQSDNVENSGVIAPGVGATGSQSVGQITVRGNLNFLAGSRLEINMTGDATFDMLFVQEIIPNDMKGVATLAGELQMLPVAPYNPVSGRTFQVLRYRMHTGTFSPVTSGYTATYNVTDVTVRRN